MTVILDLLLKTFLKNWKPIVGGVIVAAVVMSVWGYHSHLLRKISHLEVRLEAAQYQANMATARLQQCKADLQWCADRTKQFLRHVEKYTEELDALDHAPAPKEIRTYVEREIISEVCVEAVDQAFDVALEFYNNEENL